jgi:hypothetical protein
VAALLALAGCGPPPSQAPGPEAHRLNTSLSALSTACGHAYEVEAFDRSPAATAGLDRQASAQIPAIVAIYRRNPNWVFQGKTVAELVQMSESYLDSCGLHGAAQKLRAAASGR